MKLKALLTLGATAGLLALSFGVVHLLVAQGSAFRTAEAAIRADSSVSQVVGDVESVKLAWFNYSISVRGPDGDASLKTHVRGSQASAIAYVALRKDLGEWRVVRLRVVEPGS